MNNISVNYEESDYSKDSNADSNVTINEESIFFEDQNVDVNINTIDSSSVYNEKKSFSKDYNVDNSNDTTIDDTSKLVGLLTRTDVSKIPNSTLKGSFICYEAAKDFTIELSRSQVLNDLVDTFFINNDTHFKWKQTKEFIYKIVLLLTNNKNFSPQIAIAIKKTHKDIHSKKLKLDLYCQGCYGSRDKDRTTFAIKIDKQELLLEKEIIHIVIKFSKKKNICLHEKGKSYSQLRGYAREQSAMKMTEDKLYPRQLRQYELNNLSSETRFTGNRQNIPTANAAKTLSAQIKPKKSIIERVHIAIASINENHKSQYILENGEESVKKIKMWGYIQPPIKTIPLSIFLLNEASLCYYHMFAGKDPGVFIDYTGSLVR